LSFNVVNVLGWSLIFKKYQAISQKDFEIGITGQNPFQVSETQKHEFSSLDLHLLPTVEIERAECSQEIGVENGYLTHFMNSVLPINPIPFGGMTASN
jgi:hypothetical protein